MSELDGATYSAVEAISAVVDAYEDLGNLLREVAHNWMQARRNLAEQEAATHELTSVYDSLKDVHLKSAMLADQTAAAVETLRAAVYASAKHRLKGGWDE